jgi:hypothetical protein
VTNQNAIRGERPTGLPRASKTYEKGRVCADPRCDTRISTYNKRDRCWAHAEMKVPRLRGRKPAAGPA